MWLEVAIDVLWPTRGSKPVERIAQKGGSGSIPVEVSVPGAFRDALNESGELADEVVAAGVVRQGRPYSLLQLVTAYPVLIDLVRRRRYKALPREFVLAVTADRVVAFALSPWSEGDGTADLIVRIKRGERGSWRRRSVRLLESQAGFQSAGGTLTLADEEQFPVAWEDDPSTMELVALLRR
jgi:hypothetical protein